MESDLCDGNQSDSNVLLPPRKRLLAGFKKRNIYKKVEYPSTFKENGFSGTKIESLMKYHLENTDLSPEDIIENSKKAAEEAVNRAVAARAVAEEKAVIAAKAMAKAKSALELVADISDEAYKYDRYLKKNKMKKHLPVKLLYEKNGNAENCNTDEELARRLHHAINSSPRIVKNSANSDLKVNKHMRAKGLPTLEEPRVILTINGHGESEAEETDSEDLIAEGRVVAVSEHTMKDKSLKIVNGEAESSHSKKRSLESIDDFSSVGRMGGKLKQKKLPLSTCSFRDLTNTKDEIKPKEMLLSEKSIGNNNNAPSTFQGVHSNSMIPAKPTSMWKCKAFKAPGCVKQNEVMEP